MNAAAVAGALLTVGGLAGYVLGILAPYPGRSFALTALMVGLTVVTVSRASRGAES